MKRKVVGLILSVFMVLSLMPTSVFAGEAGDTTVTEPAAAQETYAGESESGQETAADKSEDFSTILGTTPNPTSTTTNNVGKALTFTAEAAGSSVKFNFESGTVEYSTKTEGGTSTDWASYTKGSEITLNVGDSVSFRGTDVTTNKESHFSMTGSIAASGDVTSLLNNGNGGNVALTTANCFARMFDGCKSLTTAPALPSMTLANSCYYGMFDGCESLTTAPALPAETLADSCYYGMFDGCTSLTTAPALPAKTLADHCYQSMFNGCTVLTTAPELPATELAASCYSGMFNGCTALTLSETPGGRTWSIPADAAASKETAADWNTGMFEESGCTFKEPVIGKTYYNTSSPWIVTFDMNGHGTAPDKQYVMNGNKATKPDNPTAEGYQFSGWYKQAECSNKWDFDSETVTDDITLYAYWKGNLASCSIADIPAQSYTGNAIEPELTVTFAGKTLTPGTDYTVSYENNINVGTASVTVTGTGDYVGTNTAHFTISKAERTAPTDIYAVKESVAGAHDGSIKGLTSEMEYRPKAMDGYTEVGEGVTEIGGLEPGTYFVRYKEDAGHLASPDTELTVVSGDMLEVTFDVAGHGTAPSAQGVSLNGKVVKPADPTEEGYSFAGWYKTSDYKTVWDFENDTVTSDTTIYGRWIEAKIIVPATGGLTADETALDKILNKYAAAYISKPDSNITSLSVSMSADTDDVSESDLELIKQAAGSGKQVKAYDISLQLFINGGTPVDIGDENDQLIIFSIDFDFTGKKNVQVFRVHHSKNEGGEDTAQTEELTETPNAAGECIVKDAQTGTIQAKGLKFSTYAISYEEVTQYTVTFNMNGHGTQVAAQTVVFGGKATEPAVPTAEGWSFIGWYLTDDPTASPGFDFENDTVTSDITLYAGWKQLPTYTVTFDMNGHGAQVAAQQVIFGNKAVKPSNPVKSGYNFAGWFTDPEGKNAYSFDDAVSQDLVLYAKWVAATPQTGDDSNGWIYLVIGIAALLAIAAATGIFRSRRRRNL